MYEVSKRMEVAIAHNLLLPYDSKCENLHGHNLIITVYCRAKDVTDYGMVVDFKHVKNDIHGYLDHQNLNKLLDFNPTAENLAKWICERVSSLCETGYCYKVTVQESEGNIATYYSEDKE
jgi:6-pyruvoyltetrahydropterin/6-carboxytetrahydropterin synthase